MTSIRQFAKRVLPRSAVEWIRRRRADLAEGAPGDRRLIVPDLGPGLERMIELESTLLRTGDPDLADKLARAVRISTRGSRGRSRGLLALARWEFYQGRPEEALRVLDQAQPADEIVRAELDLFRADCLCEIGDGRKALTILSRLTGRFTTDQNLLLRVGNARTFLDGEKGHGSGPVTEALNVIYGGSGFGMIRRSAVDEPVGVDNLTCDVQGAEPAESLPPVTVVAVVPETLPERHAGISSLLAQSWPNLEVIVAGPPELLRRLSQVDPPMTADPKVTLVEGPVDEVLGKGVARAKGDFLMLHPLGSWAHPQRIEAQATVLMVDPSLRGSVSCHLKVGDALAPRPLGMVPALDLVGPSPYTAMFRTSSVSPDRLMTAYQELGAAYSPTTGTMLVPDGVEIASEGVPLTLNLAAAWPVSSLPWEAK